MLPHRSRPLSVDSLLGRGCSVDEILARHLKSPQNREANNVAAPRRPRSARDRQSSSPQVSSPRMIVVPSAPPRLPLLRSRDSTPTRSANQGKSRTATPASLAPQEMVEKLQEALLEERESLHHLRRQSESQWARHSETSRATCEAEVAAQAQHWQAELAAGRERWRAELVAACERGALHQRSVMEHEAVKCAIENRLGLAEAQLSEMQLRNAQASEAQAQQIRDLDQKVWALAEEREGQRKQLADAQLTIRALQDRCRQHELARARGRPSLPSVAEDRRLDARSVDLPRPGIPKPFGPAPGRRARGACSGLAQGAAAAAAVERSTAEQCGNAANVHAVVQAAQDVSSTSLLLNEGGPDNIPASISMHSYASEASNENTDASFCMSSQHLEQSEAHSMPEAGEFCTLQHPSFFGTASDTSIGAFSIARELSRAAKAHTLDQATQDGRLVSPLLNEVTFDRMPASPGMQRCASEASNACPDATPCVSLQHLAQSEAFSIPGAGEVYSLRHSRVPCGTASDTSIGAFSIAREVMSRGDSLLSLGIASEASSVLDPFIVARSLARADRKSVV